MCFDAGAPCTLPVLRAVEEVADCIAGEVCHILSTASGTRDGVRV
jgi:hypothetical protein